MAAKEEKIKKTEIADTVNQTTPEIKVTFEPEKTLFEWKAPSRPFKKRDREYWITLIAIAAVFSLILFIVEGIMPVMLIIALLFLFYILSTVEPEEIEYKITNKGIRMADDLNDWLFLNRFWFTKRLADNVLVIESQHFPGRLELVIHAQDVEKIKETLTPFLPLEEAPPSNLDKAANWFSRKLPDS